MLDLIPQLRAAVDAALSARDFAGAKVEFSSIEPPRDWGFTTNVCFTLAGRAAAAEIERATAGLDKKEAKAKAAEITKSAGPKLAAELAEELNTNLQSVAAAACRRPEDDEDEDGGKLPPPQHEEDVSGGKLPPPQGGTLLPFIARVEAEGAYLNFYFDPVALSGEVVRQVLRRGGDLPRPGVGQVPTPTEDEPSMNSPTLNQDDAGVAPTQEGAVNGAPTKRYGAGEPTGKRIMVEYAQPNTHKDFHVGHLRNASIGQAIANLLEFEGNEVKKATYIGDVGAHVAKAILGSTIDSATILGVPGTIARFPTLDMDSLRFWGACYKRATLLETQLEMGLRLLYAAKILNGTIANGSIFVSPNAPPLGDAEAKITVDQLIGSFSEEDLKQPIHYTRVIDGELLSNDLNVTELVERYKEFRNSINKWLAGWERGDKNIREEWSESRESCLVAFKTIFAELLADFHPDCWFYESTVDDTHLGQQTAQELKERGIAVIDTSEEYKGALYVDFEQQADAVRMTGTETGLSESAATEGRPPYVFRDDEKKRIRKLGKMTILRSDGTSLYQTKELGLAKYKFDHFDIDESLYVVGSEQKLYFEQVFAILRLWGFPNAENCKHISYELVVLPEGKMSSREGTVVSYRELRDEAVARAEAVTREKGIAAANVDLSQTAKDIAIAAIKFAMLQVGGNQQIVFDFEQALSFDGRAAPYLQYAYARAGRLVGDDLRRGGHLAHPGAGQVPAPTNDLHPSEIALARQLAEWPAAARDAAQRYEPAVVCNYLYALAGAFNDFYRDCRVLDAPDDVKPWRQALTAAFRSVMKTGFDILALPLPEAM